MARPGGRGEARQLGRFVQANSRRLLVGVTLALLALCAALKSARLDSHLDSWIQKSARVESELAAVQSAIGEGAGSNSLLLLQALSPPKHDATAAKRPTSSENIFATTNDNQNNNNNNHPTNILSVEALMVHLEALAIATHLSVDLFDVNWSLKDLCFAPTPPEFEGLHVGLMLDNLLPCATKTPLDCFWEGSKLLGPEPPVNLGSWGPKLRWTNMDPLLMIQAKQRAHPHASFPYGALFDWMHRVGITTGYQRKPCLDPTDPNCPISAPNKPSGEQPDIGAHLTGGCRGVAANQMHWKEDEIVGGIARNKSGHIVSASALQSIIQLMGEQDMYDYWRKTSKVQDINNWSVDKAKHIIETWQRRLKDELAQFAHKLPVKSSYKIYAMTPESMLEPIDAHSMLDLTNFEICFVLMTIYLIIAFPRFSSADTTTTNIVQQPTTGDILAQEHRPTGTGHAISRIKLMFFATLIAAYNGLTFIASLGVSSFLNLPFNMATTQILPPLAMYYGFKQSLMVVSAYARNIHRVEFESLTLECLNELLPAIIIESVFFIVPSLVATMIPVEATRMFASQVILYIVLATISTILLVPSLLTTFLKHHCPQHASSSRGNSAHIEKSYSKSSSSRSDRLPEKTKNGSNQTNLSDNTVIDDQIFTRLQDDLKNVKADSPKPAGFDFSAQINSDGRLHTSIRMTSSRYPNGRRGPGYNSSQDKQLNSSFESFPNNDNNISTDTLPDLLASIMQPNATVEQPLEALEFDKTITDKVVESSVDECQERQSDPGPIDKYIKWSTSNRMAQVIICLLKLALLIAILSQVKSIKYGLQVQDIVIRNTHEYESFKIQEKFFPVYNIFAITKGNFDYPSNQQMLYEFHKRIEQVDGIIKDEETDRPKFWLTYFRDWLLELQDKFDIARNNSMISKEGWTPEASDAAKLAYKLLAQTGKPDNPIDKAMVESNRLVDSAGLINPKAFYYYLTAWIVSDAFSYSNSEANLRPEPKIWNDNPDDLRIERARPIMYAQIPFLLRLPSIGDGVRVISEMRSISNAFEQLSLPNFLTGIPFIFWDQFISLSITFLSTAAITLVSLYLVVGLSLRDFKAAAIVVLPVILTLLEIYGMMGYLGIPFNNVFAVLLIGQIGFMANQSIHHVMFFPSTDCSIRDRVRGSMRMGFSTIVSETVLLLISAVVFYFSSVDFMTRYSILLLSLVALNLINSLFIVPTLMICLDVDLRKPQDSYWEESPKIEYRKPRVPSQKKNRVYKKRKHRVQSEISLSTISEEPQSESLVHDLKLDLSIRCY